MIISCRDKYKRQIKKNGKRHRVASDKLNEADPQNTYKGKPLIRPVWTSLHIKMVSSFKMSLYRRETNSGTLGAVRTQGDPSSKRELPAAMRRIARNWEGGTCRSRTWSRNSTVHPLCKTLKIRVRCSGGCRTPNRHDWAPKSWRTALGVVTGDNTRDKEVKVNMEGVLEFFYFSFI